MTRLALIYAADAGPILRAALEISGYEVSAIPEGPDVAAVARAPLPDLIVLDARSDGEPMLDVLSALRAVDRQLPVILLGAESAPERLQQALQLGADDYVTLPASQPALAAHIAAVLRRVYDGERSGPSWIAVGEARFHPLARLIERSGQRMPLGPKEYAILMVLLRERGSVVSRPDLLREVWGSTTRRSARAVDGQIATLRQKVERDPRMPCHIRAVGGDGYILVREEDARS